MKTAMIRKAIKLYSNPDNTRSQNRRMQRQWLASMEFLGDRHILKSHSGRIHATDNRILK